MSFLTTLAALPGEALVPVSWVRDGLSVADSSAQGGLPARDLTADEVRALFPKGDGAPRSRDTINRWAKEGRFPGAYQPSGPGSGWLFPVASLEALRAKGCAPMREAPAASPRPRRVRADQEAFREVRAGVHLERAGGR